MKYDVEWLFRNIRNDQGYKKIGDCRVKFSVSGDNLIVSFPGTGTAKNWAWNFTALQIPYKGMSADFKVHAGFLKIWHDARDYIHAEIAKRQPKTILCTGYSQGGALAMLCHEDMLYHGHNSACITYAAPRVFSRNVPAERVINTHRIAVRGDIVPHVPFAIMGYRHYGILYAIGSRWSALPTWRKHDAKNYYDAFGGLQIRIDY